ncbi:MAG: HAMP domain-containing histidine kinase, partial [Actinobacteria bacterium]|nr:HAMP domain-containing histidine kinase [Actinomycetota bacterium]
MTSFGEGAGPAPPTHRLPRAAERTVYALVGLAGLGVMVAPNHADSIGPLAVLIGLTAAAFAVLHKAGRLSGKERLAWRIIGSGFATSALGVLTMGVLNAAGVTQPAFGPIDLFFLGAYGLVLSGFAFLPHQEASRVQRARVYLDAAIGAISIAAVAWVLVLDGLLHSLAEASGWERWAGSAYPILDVFAAIILMLVLSRRSALRFDPRLLLFGAGIFAQTTGDLIYLQRGIGQSFSEARPVYLIFMVAALLFFRGATIVDRQPRRKEYADRPVATWSMIAPTGAALAFLGVALLQVGRAAIPTGTRTLLAVAFVVGALVAVRQALAIRENGRVVARRRAELVASVSHEFRTPLTSIVGFLDLLADDSTHLDAVERRDLTAIASQQAHYLASLIRDLVELNPEGQPTITLEDQVEDIAALVTRSIRTVDTDGVRMTVDVEAGLEADVDARRVQQVLVNLVSNAVRYGGNAVLVRAHSERSALVFEVHDDGEGVPKKWELAIWNRFERGPQRFLASQPGTGIGLAVVADVVGAYHGIAECARSNRLGGAVFRIVLPNRVPMRLTDVLVR